MTALRYALAPIWLAQLATSAKSFRDNPIVGSRWLNRRGLHVTRVKAACHLAQRRRRARAALVADRDREALEQDGFVVRRNVLPPDELAALLAQVRGYRGPALETYEGDSRMCRIAIDRRLLAAVPGLRAVLDNPLWRGLLRYAGASDGSRAAFIKTVHRNVGSGLDPQSRLHADTFHSTVKAWLFLTDVADDGGAFSYVPGSHRLTPARLAWEQSRSLEAPSAPDPETAHGSFRINPDELAELGLPPPRRLAVPANSLVVADTFGFHARGPSSSGSRRVAVWAMGDRCPFLPLSWLDWGIAAVGRTPSTTIWRRIDDWCAFDDLAQPPQPVARACGSDGARSVNENGG